MKIYCVSQIVISGIQTFSHLNFKIYFLGKLQFSLFNKSETWDSKRLKNMLKVAWWESDAAKPDCLQSSHSYLPYYRCQEVQSYYFLDRESENVHYSIQHFISNKLRFLFLGWIILAMWFPNMKGRELPSNPCISSL